MNLTLDSSSVHDPNQPKLLESLDGQRISLKNSRLLLLLFTVNRSVKQKGKLESEQPISETNSSFSPDCLQDMDEEILCFLREDSDEEDDYDELFLDGLSTDCSSAYSSESLSENLTARPVLAVVPEEDESSGEENTTYECDECTQSEGLHERPSGLQVVEDSLDHLRQEIFALLNAESEGRYSSASIPEKSERADLGAERKQMNQLDQPTASKQAAGSTCCQSQTCETRVQSAIRSEFEDAVTKENCFECSNGKSTAGESNHARHCTTNCSSLVSADLESSSKSVGKRVVLKPILCAVCHERCDFRDTISFENCSVKLHKKCMKCVACEKVLDSSIMVKFLHEQPHCRTCFNRLSQKSNTTTESSPEVATCFLTARKSEVCTACNKNVYANESVSLSNTRKSYKYHEICLRCERCSRRLRISESSVYRDAVFCHHCMKEKMKIEWAQLSACKKGTTGGLGNLKHYSRET